ncbi:universal stress protein [Polaromonas naphthalenivorans]|uniref:Universal stress protein n=1 Tax=Polaromonas naphthalenivorans (strain CJ2) TaxID=365044 RepID=A1VLQ9_POLNA|nr:universal stress protein [Polaromonas naphthalenivorans]ABM36587.1 UspA domain protein [Polaromonas naphthalenivorans CJ2]
MFKHILVPVDGSLTARHAIDKAVAIAVAFQSAVTVIYVIDPYAFSGVGADFSYGQAEYLSAATAEADQAISAARQVFGANGLVIQGSVVEGHSVYQAILDAAESINADLIVMGSHGRRGLEKLVLGSVTAQVLSHAHLSVLVVRE